MAAGELLAPSIRPCPFDTVFSPLTHSGNPGVKHGISQGSLTGYQLALSPDTRGELTLPGQSWKRMLTSRSARGYIFRENQHKIARIW